MKVYTRKTAGALALVASAALVLSGCSSSGDSGDEKSTSESTSTEQSTDALKIATLLPQTGSLSFLMPPVQAGVAQALADINGAGGVLGQDIEVVANADEGDGNDLTVVAKGADEIIKAKPAFVLGAMGSGRSAAVVDKFSEAGILQGSPSNTSADLSGISPNYFRTAPPDTVQGNALGNQILDDGKSTVAFLTFNDPYGLGLRDVIQTTVEDGGAEVVYGGKGDGNEFPVEQTSFSSEISAVKASGAEAVVVVTYAQFEQIVPEAVNQGLDLKTFYLVDGNANGYEGKFAEGTLEGVQASIPGAQSNDDFKAELEKIYTDEYKGELDSFTYAPEAYDLVTLVALAAEKAGATDAESIKGELHAVSGSDGGEECTDFASCKALLDDDKDIHYKGKAGTGPLNDQNDPSSAFIGIYKYDASNNPVFQKAVEGETK
ncbi:MAG: ABC transporter substrate-binding protein [Leucobacter sp.]